MVRNMNKMTARAFSIGILLAVSILGMVYYFSDSSKQTITKEEAKTVLEEEGLVVLEEKEYNELLDTAVQEQKNSTSQQPPAETPAAPEQPAQPAQPEVVTYQLVITEGMLPSDIAEVLGANKIVSDVHEFNDYLINMGYHTDVQLGTYDLNSQMGFEQIAKIITKNT
jgi:hypothetical protein